MITMILLALLFFLYQAQRAIRLRFEERFSQQLVELLDVMISSLRAGASFFQSFQMAMEQAAEPLRKEMTPILTEYRLGLRLEQSLQGLSARLGLRDLRHLMAAIAIAQNAGGGLAHVLEQFNRLLRDQQAIHRRIKILSSQGKLQGWVLGLMPLFLYFAMRGLDPQLTDPFWQSPYGPPTLLALLLAEGICMLIMQRILRIEV